MHKKSQHFRRHSMVTKAKTDNKHTKNRKQSSWKLLGTHYWPSSLMRRDFTSPQHTQTKRLLVTLLLSSSRAGRMGDALFENRSDAGPILGPLAVGLQELDQSWELSFRARLILSAITGNLTGSTNPEKVDLKLDKVWTKSTYPWHQGLDPVRDILLEDRQSIDQFLEVFLWVFIGSLTGQNLNKGLNPFRDLL